MGRYIENSTVVIEDGQATVLVTLSSSKMIAAFQVEHNGTFIDTEIVTEDEEENTRIVSFPVENLNAIIGGKVSVDTGNPSFGIMSHDVRLQFDPSEIPVAKEEVPKLWPEVLRLDNPHTYYVDLSDELWNLKQNLLNKYSSKFEE